MAYGGMLPRMLGITSVSAQPVFFSQLSDKPATDSLDGPGTRRVLPPPLSSGFGKGSNKRHIEAASMCVGETAYPTIRSVDGKDRTRSRKSAKSVAVQPQRQLRNVSTLIFAIYAGNAPDEISSSDPSCTPRHPHDLKS